MLTSHDVVEAHSSSSETDERHNRGKTAARWQDGKTAAARSLLTARWARKVKTSSTPEVIDPKYTSPAKVISRSSQSSTVRRTVVKDW